jgi:hypothetical protein
MFYVLVFSILAVILVVGGISTMSRRRKNLEREETHATHSPPHVTHSDASRRIRKEKRAQSRHDRQKRH